MDNSDPNLSNISVPLRRVGITFVQGQDGLGCLGVVKMDLFQYWRMIRQNQILIVVCTIAGILMASAVTFFTTPIYQARAQIFVSTPASSLDISALATGSSFSQQRVKSYAQIINSPLTLKPVIRKLNLKVSPEELAENVTSNAPLDTVLISLSVINSDPILAAKIANEIATQFGQTVTDLELQGIESSSPVKVSTVRFAIPAESPSSPNIPTNLAIGLIFGFGLGVSLSGLRRILDNSVKNEDDIEGLPLLTAIGFDKDAEESPLVTQIGRYSARAESFRTLRTNIQYLAPASHPQVIVFTSALPGEGKTTSATNLALSLSQAGVKTILVEADLRRPKLQTYLRILKKEYGLSEILGSKFKVTASKVISSVQRDEKTGLDILFSGKVPANPSELLSSSRFDDLLRILRKRYEYVIIDCPPLLLVTDAALVSAKSDGTVLVVHAGMTKKPHFKGSLDALTTVGTTIFGVILNKIPEKSVNFEYGYRYGHPKYYGISYATTSVQSGKVYAPSAEAQLRIEREETYKRILGRRFKQELSLQELIRK
jgi:succinoglycan biosynthesis transport protein ExoP